MTHDKWFIRKISPDDIEFFRSIRLEALRAEPDAFASSADEWNAFTVSEWLQRMKFPTFVAFVDNEPVGLMGLIRHDPKKMRHRAKLVMVYVRNTFRGSGLADALLEHVFDYARQEQIIQIELVVRSDNLPAIRFYSKRRFSKIGAVPDGFLDERQSSAETIMVKQLRPLGTEE
jgi:ribosomal protein S18 acetylase RimI-like enzyme